MSDKKYDLTICCVGAGYVGGPTMTTIASKAPHIKVHVVDINKRRIDAWNSDSLPIYEPGLKDCLETCINKNLFFSTDVEAAIDESDIIFIAVNTPTKSFGYWSGNGYDLSAYESVSRSIAKFSNSSKVVVEKSTVPVLTAERIRVVFEANKKSPEIHFEVISNPEFLAEGTAMRDLQSPDRVLVGGRPTAHGQAAVDKLVSVYANWVPEDRILRTGLWSSELAKLACNAMLSQRVSSINALSAICEKTGANVFEVARVMGADSRIGPKFLNASVGFGGSCFGKDLLGLIYLCKSFELHEVAEYWEQVLKINEYQKLRFAKLIVQEMFGNVSRKNICILGYAFKKNTGDIRESPAIDVCRFLVQEGANVFVYDPKVKSHEIRDQFPTVQVENTPYAASLEAHAVCILTEWDEFKTLDYERIYKNMAKPAFIFDGRNIADHKKLAGLGFRVFCIGSGFFHSHMPINTDFESKEREREEIERDYEIGDTDEHDVNERLKKTGLKDSPVKSRRKSKKK